MPKNYNWNRDELILALDVYFREPQARGSKSHPAVLELSDLLNQLPIHPSHHREEYFRNPNSVAMKLSNFLRLDPKYEGVGLPRGSQLDEEIWEKFSNDPAHLRRVASTIRRIADSPEIIAPEGFEIDQEASEGRILTRLHRVRERSGSLARRKKQQVLDESGALLCEACGFDFASFYGDRGSGFAECHHKIPLSELIPNQRTRFQDLAIVCANCHRMIHRSRPWLTVREVRGLVKACT